MPEYIRDGHTVRLVVHDGELRIKAECPRLTGKASSAALCHTLNGVHTQICVVEHAVWNNTDPEAFSEIRDMVVLGPTELAWRPEGGKDVKLSVHPQTGVLVFQEGQMQEADAAPACERSHYDVVLTQETFKVRPFLAFMGRVKNLTYQEIRDLMHYENIEQVKVEIEAYMSEHRVTP